MGDLSIPLADGRSYRLVGGHRLWTAPEVPEITYEPDDQPVAVDVSPTRLQVAQASDGRVDIAKALSVALRDSGVEVVHRITNRGATPKTLAPWAITQLPVGGTAVIPLSRDNADPDGLQPNAEIVLWPYTGVADTSFEIADRYLLVGGSRAEPTKVGTRLDRGWMAYVNEGLAFVKWSDHLPSAAYPDRGASAQCYSGPDFVELETLGPLVSLEPGESTEHREFWRLHQISPDTPPTEVSALLVLDGGNPL